MSHRIEVVKVITPELQLNNIRSYTSVRGSQVTSAQTFVCPNPTTSSIQITCTPPSANIAISRHVLKKFTYTCTVTGTNASGSPTLLQPGFIAPRAFPIMSTTVSESMTINNTTVTASPVLQYWPAFLQYANKFDNRFGQFSLAPSMLDNFQNYNEGNGSPLNPLLGYGQSSYELGRGASVGFAITSNTATSATVVITSVEPVLMSPFVFGEDAWDTPALIGVNSMTYYATLGNINRVLSVIQDQGVPGINITNISTVVNFAALQFLYLTPDPLEPIPKLLVSSYYNVVDFPTQSNQTWTPGQTLPIQMSSVQLAGIPKRIVVFAGNSPMVVSQDTLGLLSDTYLSLADTSPLVMTWNNNQYFASYSIEQLYDLSVSNGCNMSYPQWAGRSISGQISGGHRGSVLVIEFGKDVGLAADQAPGLQGNFQLQLTTNWTNCNAQKSIVNPTLHCVVIYEGLFVVDNGATLAEINVLTGPEIRAAQSLSNVSYKRSNDIYGGSFSGFVDLLKKVPQFLRDTKLISTTAKSIPHPAAQVVGNVASVLGYGPAPAKRRAAPKKKSLAHRIRGAGLVEQDDSDDSSDSE